MNEEFNDMGFFRPAFGRPEVDGADEDWNPPKPPDVWGDAPSDVDILGFSLEAFMPHLSRRIQRIFAKLEMRNVGDLLAVEPEVLREHGSGEIGIIGIEELILNPKNLQLREKQS